MMIRQKADSVSCKFIFYHKGHGETHETCSQFNFLQNSYVVHPVIHREQNGRKKYSVDSQTTIGPKRKRITYIPSNPILEQSQRNAL